MASKWEEILSDKSTYSDDHIIKLADGTELRLGDVRPSHMKDADYRQKTSLLARQREDFEAAATSRIQAIQEGEAQLRAIAAELIRHNPQMTKKEITEEYASDPEVQRLRAELSEIKGALQPIANTINEMKQNAQASRQQYVVNEHRKALMELKADHPDLDEMELVAYAKENLVPNLKKAWTLMNHDKIVESKAREVREAALKEGYEKAKQEISAAPVLPMRTVMQTKAEGVPKNSRELMERALRDPEVMGPLVTGKVGA